MSLEPCRQAVRVGHRLLGRQDHAIARLRSDMREVAEDADAVHFGDHLVAELGQAAVVLFVATATDEVLGVVGDLHDPHAQVLEHLEEPDLVLDPRQVLPAEDDAGLALLLRAMDVGGCVDLGDQVGMVAEMLLPARNVVHAAAEVLPDRAGAVGRRQAALPHVLEHFTREVGDDEAVDDHCFVVQFGSHGCSLIWLGSAYTAERNDSIGGSHSGSPRAPPAVCF